MKRSAPIKRKTALKRRAQPRPKLTKADPHETERDFVRRLLAANASLHAERKARKPLPKQSAKGKARNALLAVAKAEFWATHDGQCEFRWWIQSKWHDAGPAPYGYDESSTERCSATATELHHRALRGRNVCNIATFCGLCAQHHRWTHQHSNEARRLGYLILKVD